jgi:ubiquitin carboxyl-terminal hydrolase 9/24
MYPYTVEGLTAAEANTQTSSSSGGSGSTTNSAGTGSSQTGTDTQMSDIDDQKQSVDSDSPEYQKKYKYELRGVVIHTGSAFAGHYYSFIKERPHVKWLPNGNVLSSKPGQWYQFDDKTVKVWDPEAMAEHCFGGPAYSESGNSDLNDVPNSAFMLFYDRMDGTCVETDPVPSFLPPSCVTDTQSQQQAVVTDEQPAAIQATAAEEANTQQQTTTNDEVPYGMPSQLYHRILKENLQLIRRLRAFDRDYIQFVRKVIPSLRLITLLVILLLSDHNAIGIIFAT